MISGALPAKACPEKKEPMPGNGNMDTTIYNAKLFNTFVSKLLSGNVYDYDFFKKKNDPDDEDNSWEAVYRLMRCPKPKARGAGC